ncbi:TetR/AcrR family transcriptional regulator [Streptomyces sp. NBC_00237]|uniref:TetR/AcrR family transcriptional regulator n=1 Tax=Streptomyces sp. NBC_00237 TaxID=2975687 RepID=UPI002259BD11|nr:TetR/AcrR family transcriptional regulator [Streptomyces sp. NBC_00237]MCX5204609.1 TetR/AcrR family transcriptional regulator [Streptomyces sp. NBC_00237]
MATSPPTTPHQRSRPMRADARRNYEKLLSEARTAFAEHGTDASLEEVARQAGVGIGTLYRHFPTRHALMSAVFQGAVDELLARAHELADAEAPCEALVSWLRAIITHAGEYRGLARALMSASGTDGDTGGPASALTSCSNPMREAGTTLLVRAQQSGAVRPDVPIRDLMQLTNAIALAAEQSPGDPELADRLLSLAVRGLRPRTEGTPES